MEDIKERVDMEEEDDEIMRHNIPNHSNYDESEDGSVFESQ
jgi:hypothetical protein